MLKFGLHRPTPSSPNFAPVLPSPCWFESRTQSHNRWYVAAEWLSVYYGEYDRRYEQDSFLYRSNVALICQATVTTAEGKSEVIEVLHITSELLLTFNKT